MKHSIALLLGLALLAQAPQGWAQGGGAGESKIRGEIYHHQKLKRRPPGKALREHRQALFAAGVNGDDLDHEEVVIYANAPFTRAEIAALLAKGIEIDPDLWIPPVPGHHPLGFHLGKVRYDSLAALAGDARVVQVVSAEAQSRPQNDVGGQLIHTDQVHTGTGLNFPRNGAGIRIAIADSGVSLTHADLSAPLEAFDVTDGVGQANWGTDVANLVTGHGTHVTGSVLGNGTLSGGRYSGAAPGATWAFYKIGNDTNANASSADEIEAINRAMSVNCRIFTMSYGGLVDFFMDGSGATEQAIDNAVANGMAVFVSAGNSANGNQHTSMDMTPGAEATFSFTISNTNGTTFSTAQTLQVIWRDNRAGNNHVSLSCANLASGESLDLVSTATSSRGTDARRYSLVPAIAANMQKTYTLTLSYGAGTGDSALIHVYAPGVGSFATPDPAFTITSPAIADGAIAVGAWVHRGAWTDSAGGNRNFGETAGSLATFSSHGPRLDGLRKPDLVAPGSATISLLDGNNTSLTGPVANSSIIDNDGLNLNGSGPANYAVMQGTSMACPMAAGVAALVLEQNPSLTSGELLGILTRTARSAAFPDYSVGCGLLDALAAVREAETPSVWVDFAYVGFEFGTFASPYNTVAEGMAAVPVKPTTFPYPPRLRIKAGNSSEHPTLTKYMQVESFGGPVNIGP